MVDSARSHPTMPLPHTGMASRSRSCASFATPGRRSAVVAEWRERTVDDIVEAAALRESSTVVEQWRRRPESLRRGAPLRPDAAAQLATNLPAAA